MNNIAAAIEHRPALGYLGSAFSFICAFISSAIEGVVAHGANIAALGAGVLGVMAGYYTFRLQRRAWKKAQAEDEAARKSNN